MLLCKDTTDSIPSLLKMQIIRSSTEIKGVSTGKGLERETQVLGISDCSPQRDEPWRIFTKITLLQTGVPSSGKTAVLEQFLSPNRRLLPCPRTLPACVLLPRPSQS